MRKFIILLLITILFIPAIPSLAAGDEGKYEVTIYPNGRGLFGLLGNDDDLVIGDVKVTYDVDYDNNEVDIYFDEAIFVSDVISVGNTVHRSIKVDSDEEIIIDKELKTDGFIFVDAKTINMKYEDISNVESITIQSSEPSDFSGGILDNVEFRLTNNSSTTKFITDNDLSTFVTTPMIPMDGYEYVFDNPTDISHMKIAYKQHDNRSNQVDVVYYDVDGNQIASKKYAGGPTIKIENSELNIKDVKRILICSLNNRVGGIIYEFNVYNEIDLTREVDKFIADILGQNVELSWENPTGEDFTGVNIYRDNSLIKQNFVGTSYIDTELQPGTYLYRITTLDISGNESSGRTISITIEEPLPQEEVSGLDYTLQGNNVTLSWTNPSNDKFEGVKIYRDGEHIETTTEESFTETLPMGTYQYRITTLEAGEESEGITIDVSVQTIPTPVKGVNMINTSSTGGSITWEPNPKAQNISKYIVYVNGEKHGEIENPPYKLEDLEVGKKYDIAVSAVNDLGEGDRSDTVSYTPSKIEDLKSTIKVGEIFSYISLLFLKVWPLLALSLTFILFPHITSAIKSVVRSRSA